MSGPPKLSERLLKRRRIWWQKPRDYRVPGTYADFLHQLRERHVLRNRTDPDENWRCCQHWQRSLLNKWNAREFALRHGVRVPELYWHGLRPSTLDVDALPDRFVVRPTFGHSRKGVFVVCDGVDLLSRTKVSREDVLRASGGTVKRLWNGPVLVEEFVGEGGPVARLPLEVKLYMFNERIGAICLLKRGPTPDQSGATYYTDSWETFSDPMNGTFPVLDPIPAPRWSPELLDAGRRLGRAFGTFVRVDFLVADERIVFGEFAVGPRMGWTEYADEYFGRLWQETFPQAL